MRQLIIARKDLNMSPGKLAAQCCHASMAFITYHMKVQSAILKQNYDGEEWHYDLKLPREIFDEWICGVFANTLCEAKIRNALMKVVTAAKELGLEENRDFFLIMDCCLTELEPEEIDENGVGRTLTCIGFKPLPDDIAHAISKKYQLYK